MKESQLKPILLISKDFKKEKKKNIYAKELSNFTNRHRSINDVTHLSLCNVCDTGSPESSHRSGAPALIRIALKHTHCVRSSNLTDNTQ